MSRWRATKAKQVLAALQRIGWTIKRQSGSHRTLSKQGHADRFRSFHWFGDEKELGHLVGGGLLWAPATQEAN